MNLNELIDRLLQIKNAMQSGDMEVVLWADEETDDDTAFTPVIMVDYDSFEPGEPWVVIINKSGHPGT